MATRLGGEASRKACHFLPRFVGFQEVAAPCQTLFFLSQSQMAKQQTVSFAAPVATLSQRLFYEPSHPLWGWPGGHSRMDFARSLKRSRAS
jgi:hypothetical protein